MVEVMKMKKYLFSELIEEITELNTELLYGLDDIVGVTIEKGLIPTIANLTKTELNKFYIVKPDAFVFNPRTHGVRLGMGYNDTENTYITSWNNVAFKVKDEARTLLNPEYLWLYFNRTEWDRETNYHAWGSSTIVFSWNTFRNLSIKLPEKEVQDKIVRQYKVIKNRIKLKKQINDNLEETAQSLFQEQFAAFYNENELPDGYSIATLDSLCSIKGGKRLPADGELLDTPTAHPYIRVRDLGSNRYVCLTNQFQYIDEETHSAISRYIVNTNDIVISIVGTIGLIGKIHTSLNNANLTENCVKLANIHTVTPDYLYYTLCYKKQIKEIELLTVGAVQSKLPMYNIQSMKILVPPAEVIEDFQHKFDIFNEQIEANTIEIQRLYELQSVLLAKLAY